MLRETVDSERKGAVCDIDPWGAVASAAREEASLDGTKMSLGPVPQ